MISTEHLSTVKNMEIDEGGACGGDSDHNCLFLTLTDKFSSFTKQRHSPKPGWNFTDDTDMSNFRNVVNREIMSLKSSNIGPGEPLTGSNICSSEGTDLGCGEKETSSRAQTTLPKAYSSDDERAEVPREKLQNT